MLARLRSGRVIADAFAYRGVVDRTGVFDNGADPANVIWGAYGTLIGRAANLDVFYIGQRHENAVYVTLAAPGTENRQSVGARIWSNGSSLAGWSLTAEGEFQFGSVASAIVPLERIRAYNVNAVISHPLSARPLATTAGFEGGLNSGDRNAGDDILETFRAPEPPGRYFGEANAFGPGNIAGVRFYLEFHPTTKLRLKPKVTLFWRNDLADGTYTLAPSILRGANGSSSYLGYEPALEVGYAFDPHTTFTGFLSHFHGSGYFTANPPSGNTTYIETTIAFRL